MGTFFSRRTRAARLLALAAAALGLASCEQATAAPADVAGAGAEAGTLYVDAAAGDDARDGKTPATAVRTIGRALSQIPSVVDTTWTIRLASGVYAESVPLQRFVMPSTLSNQQLRFEPIARSVAIVGPPAGSEPAVIAPPAGTACVTAQSVVLFLDSLTCRVASFNGISVSGSTLVLDDVRVEATANADQGVYAEESMLYMGGSLAVDGPFTYGLAVRVNSLARTGTRRNQNVANLTFTRLRAAALFVRDGGNLTSVYETGTIRIADSGQAAYALLGARVFLNATLRLELHNVGIGVAANQGSAFNAHEVVITGRNPSPFVRCHKDSYVVLETVNALPGTRSVDTDGTCSVMRY